MAGQASVDLIGHEVPARVAIRGILQSLVAQSLVLCLSGARLVPFIQAFIRSLPWTDSFATSFHPYTDPHNL
ncbi:hypothetical protein VTH06DRAFT_7853 [Thermothelomyces fergusii]